jgi:hypothetical protein
MALSASAASIWRTARSSAAHAAVPAMPATTNRRLAATLWMQLCLLRTAQILWGVIVATHRLRAGGSAQSEGELCCVGFTRPL